MSTTLSSFYGTLDDKTLKDLKGAIEELNHHMHEAKNKQIIMKEIVDIAHEKTKIPKKIIKRIAKVQFNQSYSSEVVENKEFETLFETLNQIK
jgi:hypothetical protein